MGKEGTALCRLSTGLLQSLNFLCSFYVIIFFIISSVCDHFPFSTALHSVNARALFITLNIWILLFLSFISRGKLCYMPVLIVFEITPGPISMHVIDFMFHSCNTLKLLYFVYSCMVNVCYFLNHSLVEVNYDLCQF